MQIHFGLNFGFGFDFDFILAKSHASDEWQMKTTQLKMKLSLAR